MSYDASAEITSDVTLVSDQIVLSSSLIEDMDTIALDPATKATALKAIAEGKLVYIVEAVYWTKELDITAGASKGAAFRTGGAIGPCTTKIAAPKINQTDTAKTNPAKTDPAKTDPAKTDPAKTNAAKTDTADALKADVTPVDVGAHTCKDDLGIVHLLSPTPVAIGLKVDRLNNMRPRGQKDFAFSVDQGSSKSSNVLTAESHACGLGQGSFNRSADHGPR